MLSGAQGLLVELARPARCRNGACRVMRWPWQRPAVEHRSSYTDQVVTAILASASGGGVRPALATAALETVATLYASALAACEVSGPSVVTRALTADLAGCCGVERWSGTGKRSISLTRTRRRAWRLRRSRIGTCTAVRTWRAGSTAAQHWLGRRRPPGARGARARCCISAGWSTMRGRGRVSVRYSTRPIPARLSGWIRKETLRRGDPGRSDRFCRSRSTTPTPTPTWTPTTPTTHSPSSGATSAARAGKCSQSRAAMAAADSPASARATQRLPSRQIRRESATRSCGAASERHTRHRRVVRRPARATRQHGIGPSIARSLAGFVSTSVDGLARRLEAQLLDQLGVKVAFDSGPLGGRDLLGRAAVFRRLKEGGLTIADARRAAGI